MTFFHSKVKFKLKVTEKTAQDNFFLRGIIHITPIVVLAIVLLGVVALTSSKQTDTPLTTERQGTVKSEEDDSSGSGSSESSENEDEDSSGSGSSGSDDDSSGSGSSGSDDDRDSSGSGSGDEDDEEERDNSGPGSTSSGSGSGDEDEDKDERTEFRFPSGLRIKTRERDDRRRVDIYEGGRKLRIETRDGRTIVKVENEEGEEIGEDEFEDDDEIDLGATRGGELRVRTRRNRFVVAHGRVEAHTDFPLSVDTETNELTVTTPAGSRVVTVLPQEAVDNMLAQGNVIDTLLSTLPRLSPSPATSPIATTEAEAVEGQAIDLEEEDGELVYTIRGARTERLLGLFDVFVPKTAVVSAESGELVGVRQSVLSRVLDLISF